MIRRSVVLAVLTLSVPALADAPTTDKDFCERVQRDVTGTTLPLNNVVYDTYDGFKESKTKIDPLEIAQYVTRDAENRPVRVSCKIKSSDHLQDRYGASAAKGDSKMCSDINRATVDAVYASLDPAVVKVRRDDVVIEEDDTVYMGASWVSEFDAVWRGPEAKMHVKSKALTVTWTDPKFAWAPERLRGVRYCHLVAPEYVKRLAVGEAPVPLPTK